MDGVAYLIYKTSQQDAIGQHIPAVNYLGETEIEYKDAQYEIYRTYHEKDSDEIELYLHRKAGTQKGGGQCL